MLIEFVTGTEFGALIGICVCTLDHRVETFLPPYACQNGLPTSAGPIPPCSAVPWRLAQLFLYFLAPARACWDVYQPSGWRRTRRWFPSARTAQTFGE